MTMKQPTLFDLASDDREAAPPPPPPDQPAREFAVDPRNDVVLEASAGTGKTRVLVERYVRLLEAGVDPRNVLAITFTRKAAAEMRERILASLRQRAEQGAFKPERWRAIRERSTDIQISTIDAFCFGLLREFPLEADVDPAFDIADETETGRFANEALDLAFRAARPLLAGDDHLRLLFARVKAPVLREAVALLLDRRQVAVPAVGAFVERHDGTGSVADVCARFIADLAAALPLPARASFLADGPSGAVAFRTLAEDLAQLEQLPAEAATVQRLRYRCESYFLTQSGTPRKIISKQFKAGLFASPAVRKRHEQVLAATAPLVKSALDRLDAGVDVLLARGLQRLLVIAVRHYEQLLDDHALIDFTGLLDRAVALLERQEEFARSRLKLQSRYHHLLVDEFQDTSRRQWRLIELLIDAWAEGEGLADAPTSIFVVGDRKQSIYRFRHAEVTLLDEAVRRIAGLRQGRTVRQAITTSFRAVPELLAFVNALGAGMAGQSALPDCWRYDDTDRFPVDAVAPGARRDGAPVLGLIAERTQADSAAAVADEVRRLLDGAIVRDRASGPRPARPDDVAILFRARAGHQFFEEALESRGIRTYVYKGLGFFDAPEVQDLQALIRYLAEPDSDLRAAELLRSRIVRLSDQALVQLAPHLAGAVLAPADAIPEGLDASDAELLGHLRRHVPRWLALADRVPPSELIDLALRESAYVFEMRGRRLDQARENVKKMRALVRRMESRGYATLGRLARYFETLRFGDDSNAIVEAAGAVNLMTIHAAKGLEFPIVFVVNLHMGGRGRQGGVSVIECGPAGEPEVCFGSSDATRLEEQRETEELRRLLYVAVTRARDRLYLAGEVRDGGLHRGARSLASLLPASLANIFPGRAKEEPAPVDPDAAGGRGAAEQAPGATAEEVEWVSDAGTFAFRVCRPAPDGERVTTELVESETSEAPISVPPITAVGTRVVAATADDGAARASGPSADPQPAARRDRGRRPSGGRAAERMEGTLVHRLFQRGVDPSAVVTEADAAALASKLLAPEERVDLGDPAALVMRSIDTYRRLRLREDVQAILNSGECLYEVPFSFRPDDQPDVCVRGVIDCLVIAPGGSVTALEFKTGEPRPEHEAQAALYRRALTAMPGFSAVDVRICYA